MHIWNILQDQMKIRIISSQPLIFLDTAAHLIVLLLNDKKKIIIKISHSRVINSYRYQQHLFLLIALGIILKYWTCFYLSWYQCVYLSSPQCVWAPSLGWHQLGWWSPQPEEEPGRRWRTMTLQTHKTQLQCIIICSRFVHVLLYDFNISKQLSAKSTLKFQFKYTIEMCVYTKMQPQGFLLWSYHCQLVHTSSGNSSLTSDIISDVFPTLAVQA